MTDFKLYGKCFICRKNRLFVRKREMPVKPINKTVKSRELFCTPCFKRLVEEFEKQS